MKWFILAYIDSCCEVLTASGLFCQNFGQVLFVAVFDTVFLCSKFDMMPCYRVSDVSMIQSHMKPRDISIAPKVTCHAA